LKNAIRTAWIARTPRERVILAFLVIVVACGAYVWLIQTAGQARDRLNANLGKLKNTAAHLDRDTAEYARLRALPAAPYSRTDIQLLLQTQAGAAGLSSQQLKINALSPDRVQVIFTAAPFASVLDLLGNMKSQRVHLSSARIEALPAEGLISGTGTFIRDRLE